MMVAQWKEILYYVLHMIDELENPQCISNAITKTIESFQKIIVLNE